MHSRIEELYRLGLSFAGHRALVTEEEKTTVLQKEATEKLWLLNRHFGTKFPTQIATWVNDEQKMSEMLNDIYYNIILGVSILQYETQLFFL